MTLDHLDDDTVACRVCQCTDNHACPGGCCWMPDPLMLGELCSACSIRPSVGGLDLSIAATGVAHWADVRTETWVCTGDGDDRLLQLRFKLLAYLEPGTGARPDLLLIEDLLFSPRAARSTGITSMVHGIVRCDLLDRGIPFLLIPPATLKTYATGNGGSSKPDMRMELYKRTGVDIADDNCVDAWFLRAIGLDLLGEPLLELPKGHRRALDKLKLPAGVA